MRFLLRTAAALTAALCLLAETSAAADETEIAPDMSLAREVDRYLTEAASEGGDPNEFRAFWKTGIRFETANGNFKIQLIGRLMWDTAWRSSSDFPPMDAGGNNITMDNTFFRRARLGVQGTVYKNTAFKVQFDFATGTVLLKDLFVGLNNLAGDLKLSVIGGHFKEPFGLEELTSSKYIFFLERSAGTNAFAPSRNAGIYGRTMNILKGRMYAAIGIFKTVNNQGAATGDGDYSMTLRVAGLALHNKENHTILHFGFGFTYRGDDMVQYRARPDTGSGDRLVDTGPLNVDDSSIFNFEIAFIWRGLSASAEIFFTDTDVVGQQKSNFTAGYITVGYWITGENQAWKNFMFSRNKPNKNLYDGGGGYGAVWVGYRFDTIDLNDGSVTGGEQDAHSFGVIWQWNPNTRMLFNYIYADVKSGPEGAGKLNVFEMRWQFDF
ncbi:MAG: OprO/OprP family phosphate-selective porin [Planctomycetota bacterium]|jgi:phosphate-selective porin OprO/OprP